MKANLTALNGRINGTHKAKTSHMLASIAGDVLNISIYGDIGESFWGDGVTAAQVKEQLDAAPGVSNVNVRINSPGGNCFEGVAIYNLLQSFPAAVTVIVEGLAASAASLIAMAGDKIVMGKGTMLMIHPAQMVAMGDSVELRECAAILEKVTGQMADIYAARTGLSKDELIGMMYAETWMGPEDAIAKGFADTEQGAIDSAAEVAALAKEFDLSVFGKVPEHLKALVTQGTEADKAHRARLRLQELRQF